MSKTNPGNRLKMPEAGFRGWREHTFFEGFNPDGSVKQREGWKNTLTDEEFIPPKGWNGEPPAPTGDLSNLRHTGGSPEFWAAMAEAGKKVQGEVVKQRNGRLVIRYA